MANPTIDDMYRFSERWNILRSEELLLEKVFTFGLSKSGLPRVARPILNPIVDHLVATATAEEKSAATEMFKGWIRTKLAQDPNLDIVDLFKTWEARKEVYPDIGDDATTYYRSIFYDLVLEQRDKAKKTNPQGLDERKFLGDVIKSADVPINPDQVKARDSQIKQLTDKLNRTESAGNKLVQSTANASRAYALGPPVSWKRLKAVTGTYFSGMSPSSIEAALKSVQAERKTGKISLPALTDNDIEALLRDTSFRVNAADVAQKASEFVQATSDMRNISQVIPGLEGDQTFQAMLQASLSAGTAIAKIAGITANAVGPLGPLEALSIASAVAGLVSDLQAFGPKGPEPSEIILQQLKAVMEAIQKLQELVLTVLSEQRANFALIDENLGLLLAITSDQVLHGFRQCQYLQRDFEKEPDQTPSAFKAYLKRTGYDYKHRFFRCVDWLRNEGSLIVNGTTPSISKFFTLQLDIELSAAKVPDKQQRDALRAYHERITGRAYPGLLRLLKLSKRHTDSQLAALSLYPIDTAGQLAAKGAKAVVTDHSKKVYPLDLGGRMRLIGGSHESYEWSIISLLSEPLNTNAVLGALESVLLIDSVYERIKLGTSGDTTTIDEPFSQLEGDERNGLMLSFYRNLMPLAIIAVAFENLQTGDVLLPIIDEILNAQGGQESCPKEPQKDSDRICDRLGVDGYVSALHDAINALHAYPVIRQNLIIYRLSNAGKGRENWDAAYAFAYDAKELEPMKDLFPGFDIRRLDGPSMPSSGDSYTDESVWFVPISGSCAGTSDGRRGVIDKRLNGKVTCIDGRCDGEVVKRDNGTLEFKVRSAADFGNDVDAWEAYAKKRCVMAALPRPGQLAAGLFEDTYERMRVNRVVERFVERASYRAFYSQNDSRMQWFVLFNVRPKD